MPVYGSGVYEKPDGTLGELLMAIPPLDREIAQVAFNGTRLQESFLGERDVTDSNSSDRGSLYVVAEPEDMATGDNQARIAKFNAVASTLALLEADGLDLRPNVTGPEVRSHPGLAAMALRVFGAGTRVIIGD